MIYFIVKLIRNSWSYTSKDVKLTKLNMVIKQIKVNVLMCNIWNYHYVYQWIITQIHVLLSRTTSINKDLNVNLLKEQDDKRKNV